MPQCRRGVFQYVFVKIALTFLTLIFAVRGAVLTTQQCRATSLVLGGCNVLSVLR